MKARTGSKTPWFWLTSAIFVAAQAYSASQAPTLTTIAIDGSFEDWNQVFTNTLQMTVDGNASGTGAGCYPTNPDRDCVNIDGTGRDILRFAWTYDNTNIYTFLERERSTSAVMHYSFIMDLNEDELVDANDRVLEVRWSSGGNSLAFAKLYAYAPANPAGDPLACPNQAACPSPGAVGLVDGYRMPGANGAELWSVTNIPGGSTLGDRFEVYIPWAQLGVPAGSPVFWHVASSTNGDFTTAKDNLGGPDGTLGSFGVFAVAVTPAYEGSIGSPGTVNYCHTITNAGQFKDRYNLTASSSIGAPVAIYTDNGACGPGTQIALDGNGDGDFSDVGDTAPLAAHDSNGDGVPNTEELAGLATTRRVFQVRVPAGLNNAVDLLTVTATSLARPDKVSATVTDKTRIGSVTLAPELWRSGMPGAQVAFGPFTVQNNQGVQDVFDYSATSSQGYTLTLHADDAGSLGALLATDTNGDGTWDGVTPNTGTVAAGGQARVWLQATIPGGATIGTTGVVRLRAVSQSLPVANATSVNTLAVLSALTLTPSYTAPQTSLIGNVGTTVYLPHQLINSQPSQDTVTLSIGSGPAAGYQMRWFTDPDCDGRPQDGALVAGPLTVAGFGGTACFVTEVKIPATGAGTESLQTTVGTGTLTGATATARDDVTVSALQTFADSNYSLARRAFGPCDTIYVRADGLTGGTTTTYNVRFLDSASQPVTTITMPTEPSGIGRVSYPLAAGDLGGNWTIQLRQGTTVLSTLSLVLVERSGTIALTVPASGQNGQPLALSAQVASTATRADYLGTDVMFAVKDPSLAVVASDTVPVSTMTPGASRTISNAFSSLTYPVYGTYTITSTWRSSCGGTLAVDSKTMPVPPPAPTLSAPANGAAVATTTPTLQGSAEADASVDVYVDGVLAGTVTGGSFSFTSAALGQGSHSWYAIQRVNGVASMASASRTVVVDTGLPAAAIGAPADGSLFNASAPPITLSGTSTDGTSGVQRVEVSINGGTWTLASGTTTWSYAFTPPADGSYSVRARAVDLANNTGAASTAVSFTYDGTAPETTMGTTPALVTNATTADLGFSSSEPSSTFECSLDGAAFAACTSPKGYTSLADGSHTFLVRATDPAGNLDLTAASFTWTVDTQAPTASFTATPPAVAASTSGSFSFTASETGSTFQCSLDGAGFVGCTTPRTLSGLAQGSHTFQVRAVDPANNPGAAASYTWTVDTVAPTSTITAPATGSAFNTGPISVTVTATDATTSVTSVEVRLNGGSFQPTTGTGPYAFSFTPTSDGVYVIESRATDTANNPETPSSSVSITWDTQPPQTTITSSPQPASPSDAASFAFTSSEPLSTFACSLDGAAYTTCSTGISFTGLSNGSHTFRVIATDRAGNPDPTEASHTWTVDTQAPTVTFSQTPAALTQQTTADFAFAASETATLACSHEGAAFAACTSPQSFPGLLDGAHSFRVRATDTAGNPGPIAAFNWTVDTVAPTVTFTGTPAVVTASSSASFTFTASEAATFECSHDGAAFGPCSSGVSLTGLTDATHTYEVRATDGALNVGPAAIFTWRVDTDPPDTGFTSTPAASDSSTTATFNFSSDETTVTYECKLDGAATFTGCSDPQSFNMLADGPHTLQVRALDAALNVDPSPATYNWTVDTSLPDTTIVAAPAPQTKQQVASFSFDSSASPATYECKLDLEPGFTSCPQTQSYTGLAEGVHTLLVRSLNAALTPDPDPASYTWTVDLTAPAAPTLGPVQANDNTPTLTGTAEPGSTVTITIDGVVVGTALTDASGNWTFTPTTALADGPRQISVTATDPATNTGQPTTVTVTIDTDPPAASFTNTPPALAKSASARFEFSSDEGGTFRCSQDNAAFVTCTTPRDLTLLADGDHTFRVIAVDLAQNQSPIITYAWKVDTQPPTATITSAPATLTNLPTAAFQFTSDESGSFECSLDSATFGPCVSGVSYGSLLDGVHQFEVRAIDDAGNVGAVDSHSWTVDGTPPTVTITSGPPARTNAVTASLTFTSEAGVTFECSRDGLAFESCTSPKNYAGLTDGDHTFEVRATDPATNVGPAASRSWTIDRLAPTVTFTSTPLPQSKVATASFEFTASETGSTFECSLDGATFATCATPHPLSGLLDGSHTLEVRATDVANNQGAATPYTWTVDTLAPGAPVLAAIAANDSTPTISGTAEAGSTVTITIDGVVIGTTTASGTGAFSFTPATALTDGDHAVSVTATDAADNTGAPAQVTVTTDTVAPTVQLTGSPATLTKNATALFTFTSSEAGTFRCSIDQTPYTTCPSPQGYFSLADGQHTFEVMAVDVATNQSTPASHTWTIDTVAPTVSFTAAPPSNTKATTATFDFQASETSTFECSLDSGAFAACTPAVTLTGLLDGNHTYAVRAIDQALNTGPLTSHSFRVDTVAPVATITSGPATETNQTTATFAFSSNESGTLDCSLDGAAFTPCTSPLTNTGLSEGSHTFRVQATDVALNVGSPATWSWTVDVTAPLAPVVNAIAPADNTPAITGTAEAGSTVTIEIDGIPVGTATADVLGQWTFTLTTAVSDGTHTVGATATDAAGNSSAETQASFLIDTGAPTTTITQQPAALTNQADAFFSFTASEQATFQCSVDGAAFAACTSPATFTGFTDGVHTVQVRATDAAGNTGAAASHSWTVDLTSPDTTLTATPAAISASGDASFSFGSEANATFECSIDGAAYVACTSPDAALGLLDGSHTFLVRAVDAAGNKDATPASYTWTVDTTPPDTTITQGAPPLTSAVDASFEFTATETPATFECSLDGAAFAACTSPSAISGLGDGDHTFRVRATDVAGNVDPSPASWTWKVDTGLPETTIETGPVALVKTREATFVFSSNETGASFECSTDSGAFEACATPLVLTVTTDGSHTLQVRAKDQTGNLDPTPASWTWEVDTAPPDTTLTSMPDAVSDVKEANFTFEGSEPGLTFECALDGAAFTACTSPVSLEGLDDGQHELRVRAVDAAGNADPTPAIHPWVVKADPLKYMDVAIAGGGCGCSSDGGAALLPLGALLLGLLRRRRRSAQR